MGKKRATGGVNKTEAILKYVADNPKKPPREVAADLTAQGVPVSAAYVSNVKSGGRRKKKKSRGVGRPRKSVGGASGGNSLSVAVDSLIRAKRLADQLGGIEKAKQAMDALARLSE